MPQEELHLKRLQNNCTVTLDRYMEAARETCEMVGTLRKLPVSKDRRLAVFLQRKREEEAMAAYQKSAKMLLAALEIAPDFQASEPQPLPAGTSRSARVNNRRRGIDRTGT
jgi:hypothetical protein